MSADTLSTLQLIWVLTALQRPWTVIGLIVTVNVEPAAYVQDVGAPICTLAQLADVVSSDHPPANGAPPTHESTTSQEASRHTR